MNKQEFLSRLKNGLSALSEKELEERLTFYGEMIDDRIEEGLTEEDAVAAVGSVDEIIAQILSEISPEKSSNDKPIKQKNGETVFKKAIPETTVSSFTVFSINNLKSCSLKMRYVTAKMQPAIITVIEPHFIPSLIRPYFFAP